MKGAARRATHGATATVACATAKSSLDTPEHVLSELNVSSFTVSTLILISMLYIVLHVCFAILVLIQLIFYAFPFWRTLLK